jgi:hypothetical protein
MSSSSSESARFDPARRRLCPDGTCIGLLDDGGRCKVCDRRNGEQNGVVARPAREDEVARAEPATEAGDEPAGPAFDPARRLCDDGTCVGVIGADGRCGLCGAASSSTAPEARR